MDPVSLFMAGSAIAGIGMSIYGAQGQAGVAQEQAKVSADIAGLQQQENAQRYQQMVLNTTRQQMEISRNMQRARAMALNTSVNQGSSSGSGLQGGYGQISGQGKNSQLGVGQNFEIGTNIYGLNTQISEDKAQLALLGGEMAEYQGYSAIGGALTGASGSIGKLGGLFTPSASTTNYNTSFWNSQPTNI